MARAQPLPGSAQAGSAAGRRLARAAIAASWALACTLAPAGGRWQRTTDGCLVWDALPQREETVAWSGACVDGKASGSGTEIYRYRADAGWKEERYVGEMKAGKLDGAGTLVYDDGDRFDGRFEDGRRVGRGTYAHANGDRYEGDFVDDRRTGQGIFTYHAGGRYEGGFVDGTFEGHGVFTFADGDRYEGEFRRGLPDGAGTFRSAGGDTLSGRWSQGCLREGGRVAAVGTSRRACGFE